MVRNNNNNTFNLKAPFRTPKDTVHIFKKEIATIREKSVKSLER